MPRLPTVVSGLRPRLVLLAILPAFAGVLLAALASWQVGQDLKMERAESVLEAGADRVAQAVGQDADRLEALAAAVALRPDVRAAVRDGDATTLRALAVPLFEALRNSDPTIAVFEFTDATGRVLMRGHNPGVAGDDKSRVADVVLGLRGQTGKGITFSPTSRHFAIGALLPVRDGGRIVGTVKVASRFDAATAAALAQVGGGQVVLFAGEQPVASSIRGLSVDALPPGIATTMRPVEFKLAGLGLTLAVARPLSDVGNTHVGSLVLLHDMAPWTAAEQRSLTMTLLVTLVLLLAASLLGWTAARHIAGMLGRLGNAMEAIAGGRLQAEIPGRERRDELGGMARALEVFRDAALAKVQLDAEAAASRALEERRARAISQHTEDFGTALGGVMRSLGDAAETMAQAAASMAASAKQAESCAVETARAAETSVSELGSVAAATEELTASVGEIARQAGNAAEGTRAVVIQAEQADGTMQRLAVAATTIGDVARLIGQITAQTNLLALSATIEAARAGDAGKGFAVVAGEVKSLAAQTAKATEEITAQIRAIQAVVEDAVGVVRGMAGELQEMGQTSAAIATAVDQQGAATREIASSVARVLDSSRRSVEAMREARDATGAALAVSLEVEGGARNVDAETGTLRREVEHFVTAIKLAREDRRLHDRVAGSGLRVEARMKDGPTLRGRLLDLSRGGLAFEAEGARPREFEGGKQLVLDLPGAGSVTGRVARLDWPIVALVVTPDEATSARMNRLIAELRNRAAA